MFEADPNDQKQLVQLLTKAVRRAGTFTTDTRDVANFKDLVMSPLADASTARPMEMRMLMLFFRAALWLQGFWLAVHPCASTSQLQYHDELRQALRFGVRFGRMAGASQRAWCQREIERLGITYFDAPILVWSRTIDFRRGRICFGHWDWIIGLLAMYQVFFMIFMTVVTCMCPCFQPYDKVIYGAGYLTCVAFLFQFHKGRTFDVYTVGRRYFKARGWGFTPAIRARATMPLH
ncbi:hypothetical protein [Duganella sp. S19_KUP01_CR8]|uniref:hypothetical protein n=1 Tax=Duganella sp. S19_KUP01_CR8 TaxID=3025502 RepID=UPI002FCDBE71